MPETAPKWGIVSTVKAPMPDVLGFAAWHLEQGAHRLYIYLDAPDPDLKAVLKAHPKIRVTMTGKAYWERKGRRPAKHQPRQTINAADAYDKRIEVDWLTHIDCDEFLAPTTSLPDQLAALPPFCLCARVRPWEALAHSGPDDAPRLFKGFAHAGTERQNWTRDLYPNYGSYLNGGFLSHVAGKLFYRTGLVDFHVKIHNAFLGAQQNPGQIELDQTRLLHMHGNDWDTWFAHFKYRHEKGAYRAELKATAGGLTMHDLLGGILEDGGEKALRAFWEEVCTPRPELLDKLDQANCLHRQALNLPPLIAKHFPQFAT